MITFWCIWFVRKSCMESREFLLFFFIFFSFFQPLYFTLYLLFCQFFIFSITACKCETNCNSFFFVFSFIFTCFNFCLFLSSLDNSVTIKTKFFIKFINSTQLVDNFWSRFTTGFLVWFCDVDWFYIFLILIL